MDKIVNQGQTKIEVQNIYLNNNEEVEIYDNLELTDEFQKEINQLGTGVIHPDKEIVEFDDIYTCPDLKPINIKSKNRRFNKYKNLNDIIERNTKSFNIMLLGNDASGKSSALKYLTKWFYYKGFIPIIIDGKDIKNNIRINSVVQKVKKQFGKQYKSDVEFETILEKDANRFVILIDDFHLCTKKKNKYWYYLLKNIQPKFSNLILTGATYTPLNALLSDSHEPVDIFEKLDIYALQPFGPKLRYKIANKWSSLGIDFPDLEKDKILEKTDVHVSYIEQIIGRGYVPSYPVYILTLLQISNSQRLQNPQYSIHGFYYELLINASLSKAVKDSDDIGVFNNLLSHIAYYFFLNRKTKISKDEFDIVVKGFIEEIDIEDRFSTNTLLKTLSEAKLLNVNSHIYFYPKYVYYFFVAKYLANNLNSHDERKASDSREIISKLSKRLYHNEFSSIIIFLTHLSKDKFIINELLANSSKIFDEFTVTKLEEDVKEINDLIEDIPEKVLRLITVNKAREEQLNFQEEVSLAEQELLQQENENICHYDDDLMDINFFEQLTLAMNTIEILGQIAKKYWGEIDGNLKLKIATETYFLGLRTMSMSTKIILNNQDVLISLLKSSLEKKIVKDKHILSDFELREHVKSDANQYLFNIAFLMNYGMIKRISNSIGSKKISGTLSKIVESHPYNSVKLIDVSVKLDYRYSFPWEELENKDYITPNRISYLIKQSLITHYLYMYETDRDKKIKIAEKFGIKVKDQLIIDNTSREKRSSKKVKNKGVRR